MSWAAYASNYPCVKKMASMNSKHQIIFRSKFLLPATVLLLIMAGLFFLLKDRLLLFIPQSPISRVDLVQEFSGSYYMGDMLGLNCRFDLNPDNTFKINWTTDAGGKAEYKGSISVKDMQFVLITSVAMKTHVPCFHRTFIPVVWGERRYLLPNDDDKLSQYIATTFCRSVKSGDEPRDKLRGFAYLRTTDISINVTGFPVRQDGRLQCPIFSFGQ